ncbi:hypothetical protein U062_00395 [Gammaproteobacteria bacterium MOLA455]|nr:hypothetical protein U062_00395 [Gammaproteobacteria bacterium MOLA455]
MTVPALNISGWWRLNFNGAPCNFVGTREQGANEWWEADQWPLPGVEATPMYLHSEGRANSHRGRANAAGLA